MKAFKRIALIFTIIFCVSLTSTYSMASQEEVDRLKEQADDASNAVNDIKNKKQESENKKSELESTADSLTSQINSLNGQISSVTSEISDTEEDIATVEADIELLNETLEETKESLELQKKSMKLRIQYMYETKSTNQLVNLLESGTLAEFMQRLEYMAQISSYDQAAVETFEATQASLEETEAEIESKYEELSAYNDSLNSKKSELGTLVSSTTSTLNDTNSQIDATEDELAELEEQLEEAEAYEASIQQQYLAAQVALAETMASTTGSYSGDYSTTDEETLMLAAIIQAEAANQGDDGRLAVGNVVMNRVASSKFPNTIAGVIYQSNQFAPVASGRFAIILAQGPNSACIKAAQQAIAGVQRTNALFFTTVAYANALNESQIAEGKVGFLERTEGEIINAHYFYNYK